MRCVHCDHTKRDVSLWNQIMAFERGTVCCFIPDMLRFQKR